MAIWFLTACTFAYSEVEVGETSHAEHIQEGHVVYCSMFAKYIHKTSLPGARKRRPFEIQTSKTSALVGPDVEASGGVRTVHGGRRTSILWPCTS